MSLFSGWTSVWTVPAGSLSKASLVGAKTVKGPGPDRVSTRPAALTAATRVVWSFELTAFWTMVLVGYMAAPPTMGSLGAAATPGPPARPAPSTMAATAIKSRDLVLDIFGIL